MINRACRNASVAILGQQLDEVMATRDYAICARWVSLQGDYLTLPRLFERSAAALQVHADRVANRLLVIDRMALGGPRMLCGPAIDPDQREEHANFFLRMLARLLCGTQVRTDVASAIGDQEHAGFLAHERRALELLLWQVDYHSRIEE